MRRLLRTAALLSAATAAATALAVVAVPSSAAEAPRGASPASVTATTGPFAGLQVTVSQTRNLINQVVQVSWSGARDTVPSTGRFGTDYLQIMQCWGDDAAGPRREQCQFGGRTGDNRGGAFSTGRQVSYGPSLVDPLETYLPPADGSSQAHVPFESATGKRTDGPRTEFFDGSTTNEIAYARTRAGGRGNELFEVQTAREAPGLGCGVRTATSTARSCWLVVVPRDDREVDGTPRSGSGAFELQSSPLSASNWQHRLVVPLQFEALGSTCPQTSERRLVGQELFTEAVTRWQPALCADGGATYGWSQVTDVFARQQVTTGAAPGLVVVGEPVDPSAVDPARPLLYAPVALHGLTISFLVERVPVPSASEASRRAAGLPVEDLRLTPRLVAKLLTQSYRNATSDDNPATRANPEQITQDREFLALNPEFRDLVYISLSDVVVPVGQADAYALVWEWISADPEARAWLDGSADEQGMVVHPAYQGLALPLVDFPKRDEHCRRYVDDRLPLCSLERRPFAADLQEAGRAAGRGENLARQSWDPLATPPQWRRTEAQPNGSRAVLALTDVATADRYGLRPARLRNLGGQFVAPDAPGMLAALGAMTPTAVPGVLRPDATTPDPAAYPLTTLSYAVTAPAALSAEEGREYAAFLDYAAGPGQVPGIVAGTLPEGYVPLPDALRAQTRAAAVSLRQTAGIPVVLTAEEPEAPPALPAASPAEVVATAPSGPSSFSNSLLSGTPTAAGGLDALLGVPEPVTAGPAPEAPPVALSAAGVVPAAPLGAARLWLPALLLVGVVAGLLGPSLARIRPGPDTP